MSSDSKIPEWHDDADMLDEQQFSAIDETRVWTPQFIATTGQPIMWLIISQPEESRGQLIRVQPGGIIGRQGEMRWNDPRMSRHHAHIMLLPMEDNPDKQVYAIAPFHDRNGTYVNGQRIDGLTVLHENDTVVMGDTHFVVKVLE